VDIKQQSHSGFNTKPKNVFQVQSAPEKLADAQKM
jgi:hypothetical protein